MRLFPLFVSLLVATRAGAYEAATRAGLTERAALHSSLHKRLKEGLARSLGLYDQLTLPPSTDAEARTLASRLDLLDPEGGYAPQEGTATALSWLVAGAVLEGIHLDRQQNHFFDPTTGRGLTGGEGFRSRLAGVMSGAHLDGRGRSLLEWLSAPPSVNDWGLARYYQERRLAVTAPSAAEREGALVRSLLAAGALLGLVEQAADPAHVRNDYRRNYEELGAPFERYVADRFGRTALPAPKQRSMPQRFVDIIHSSDGSALADRTAAHFFSPGTLPNGGGGTGRASLPQIAPPTADSGYLSGVVPHLVAYRRTATGLIYWLDTRCLSDYAEALLPEAGGAAEASLEYLFRGQLSLAIEESEVTVRLSDVTVGEAKVSLFWDDEAGRRHPLGVPQKLMPPVAAASPLLQVPLPVGARRLAALVAGRDALGEPLVISAELPIK
jgi:hypothetical protein